jgi:hypothetical protein
MQMFTKKKKIIENEINEDLKNHSSHLFPPPQSFSSTTSGEVEAKAKQ